MHPVRKQRLIVVLAIVLGSTALMALGVVFMKTAGNLFYPVSDIVNGVAPLHKTIRAGGCVVPGTIVKASDRLHTEFVITDGTSKISVTYGGILPDIFGDGEAAVITGKLEDSGILVASQVLAKHDENYVPPEVADTLTDTEKHNEACKGMNFGSI